MTAAEIMKDIDAIITDTTKPKCFSEPKGTTRCRACDFEDECVEARDKKRAAMVETDGALKIEAAEHETAAKAQLMDDSDDVIDVAGLEAANAGGVSELQPAPVEAAPRKTKIVVDPTTMTVMDRLIHGYTKTNVPIMSTAFIGLMDKKPTSPKDAKAVMFEAFTAYGKVIKAIPPAFYQKAIDRLIAEGLVREADKAAIAWE